MTKIKTLLPKRSDKIICGIDMDPHIAFQRKKDYVELSPSHFAKKYSDLLFTEGYLIDSADGERRTFQYNFCVNPFCKWYGLSQCRFEKTPNKPYRYKVVGAKEEKRLHCNPDRENISHGIVCGGGSYIISNWSVGEEIKRLKSINRVMDIEPVYNFHRDNCSSIVTPAESEASFYKRGKSSSNSQKWQCKECNKITNVLPGYRSNYGYHQKRNDILLPFLQLLVGRTPVKRTCEILQIGSSTYYSKLEWTYRKCLEFLEKYENKVFQETSFGELWVNSDKFTYFLNNIRRKGQRKKDHFKLEEIRLPINVVVSTDMYSRYVFRGDIAYDFTKTLEDIEEDTRHNFDDHAYEYQRQNGRLKYSFAPQEPTKNDIQTMAEYLDEKQVFDKRKEYIEGCQVKSNYTAIAHYWLLKESVKANTWHFVSDEDYTLINSVMRVFEDEVRIKDLHYFISQINKDLNKKEAYAEYIQNKNSLKEYALFKGLDLKSLYEIAKLRFVEDLAGHKFYEYRESEGKKYPIRSLLPIEHPLPDKDQGKRYIRPFTDISDLTLEDQAKLLIKVNTRSVDTFLNVIRRRISVLERPLATSRGDGKTYIYSNYNPRYAQYAITILRTLYNFCWTYKSFDGKKLTPAQRLGITNKVFDYKEIIYFG